MQASLSTGWLTENLLRRWEHVSDLTWHTYPVLCLASLQLAGSCDDQNVDVTSASSPASTLLISGATDGSVALWHIQHSVKIGSSGQGAAGLEAQRVLCLPAVHQSGVNAASIALVKGSSGSMHVCKLTQLPLETMSQGESGTVD